MNVLVTGATGFIGSWVANALVAAGHRVRVSVRPTSDTRWLEGVDVEHFTADLGPNGNAAALVENMDAVVHGAGVTRAPNRETFLRVNADGTRVLAEAAAGSGVGLFVLLSSMAARGPDQAQAPGDAPVSWYGLSKLQAERAVRVTAAASGLSGIALRLGGVYGPRDTDLLPLFQSAARGFLPLPPAHLEVQPIHVHDVVESVLAALERDPGFGPWMVAQQRTYEWDEMGRALCEALDRRVVSIHVPRAVFLGVAHLSEAWASLRREAPRLDLRRAEDLAVFSYTGDVRGAMEALDWTPSVELQAGLRDTAAWYRDRKWIP